MSRTDAIARAQSTFDDGRFKDHLSRLVAIPTESQNPERADEIDRYLGDEMKPAFEAMGFACRLFDNPKGGTPFLFAERIESHLRPTILGYGHGDVVRGLEAGWAEGLSPWRLTERDERWYGRGIVDNKGQHLVNMTAMRSLIDAQGSLGFNAKYLIEMGEETGSPGLRALCEANADLFSADLLIASDGPRLRAERPSLFLGARGALLVDLTIDAREGGHHSGNWGGLLSNPGIELAHAIAAIVGPTGQIRIPEMVPAEIPASVKAALADCVVDGGPGGPIIEPWWGEPGLSAAEKVFGWCNFEVLAFETGNPKTPVNAIPPRAWARCQLRFVVGIDPDAVLPAMRRHLARHGLAHVKVEPAREELFPATRLDPAHPYARWAAQSIERTTGIKPNVLPNFGGALPNDIFVDVLDLPTLWVPHSYPGCSQHAPNEHVPKALMREGLGLMTGLYADMTELPEL